MVWTYVIFFPFSFFLVRWRCLHVYKYWLCWTNQFIHELCTVKEFGSFILICGAVSNFFFDRHFSYLWGARLCLIIYFNFFLSYSCRSIIVINYDDDDKRSVLRSPIFFSSSYIRTRKSHSRAWKVNTHSDFRLVDFFGWFG